MNDIDDVREIAKELNISYSGNTGLDTLKRKIIDHLQTTAKENSIFNVDPEDDEIQVAARPTKRVNKPTLTELANRDPQTESDPMVRRQIVRAKAMRLHRIRIVNLDPSDAQLPGAIVTVYNKYTGKVSKFIPFGDESTGGYHVPEIIVNHLKNQKFALRREKKGGKFGVKAYSTSMVHKFSITELPPLTPEEIADMAARQAASQAIA